MVVCPRRRRNHGGSLPRHEPRAGLMRVITYPVYFSIVLGAMLRGRLYQQNHAVGIVNDLKP